MTKNVRNSCNCRLATMANYKSLCNLNHPHLKLTVVNSKQLQSYSKNSFVRFSNQTTFEQTKFILNR